MVSSLTVLINIFTQLLIFSANIICRLDYVLGNLTPLVVLLVNNCPLRYRKKKSFQFLVGVL